MSGLLDVGSEWSYDLKSRCLGSLGLLFVVRHQTNEVEFLDRPEMKAIYSAAIHMPRVAILPERGPKKRGGQLPKLVGRLISQRCQTRFKMPPKRQCVLASEVCRFQLNKSFQFRED